MTVYFMIYEMIFDSVYKVIIIYSCYLVTIVTMIVLLIWNDRDLAAESPANWTLDVLYG